MLLQRLDNGRYVPVRRPMMLDQVVDAEDEFGYGRTVEIILAIVVCSWFTVFVYPD